MNILARTTRCEALRRWALGEIDSKFFNSSASERLSVEELLNSRDREKVKRGLRGFLNYRRNLITTIPENTVWHTAVLDVSLDEFRNLRTIFTTEWGDYSQGTYELAKAAATIKENPGRDHRIDSIRESLAKGPINTTGITLLSESRGGPYTIAEGNGRLVALYLDRVLNRKHSHSPNTIEVVLGISSNRWVHSPPSHRG